ncbi:MAG: endonuclease/exonuclease/phosphatase family protein [Saprospiraceae bacterium]|nr:endonuclease/exonuclease/phosphatase family protein [Saprospiraceae bacterium]
MKFLYSLTIVWGILCVIMYLIEGLNPEKFWIFSISSLIIPISFIINFFLIGFWVLIHWRYAWLPLVIILTGYFQLNKLVSFKSLNDAEQCSNDKAIKVMSFNLYGLKNLKDTLGLNFQKNKSQFLTFLRKNNPDVLCVQENNLFSDDVISKSDLFPYVHYILNHGAAIYSKFPMLDQGNIDFGTNTNSCLWADILIEGRRIRTYSMHLQSNSITKQVGLLKEDDDTQNIEKLNVVKQMLRKFRRMSVRRAKQADLVRDHAVKSLYPVILAGDFNDTPFSYVYKVLTEGRNDSFLKRGNGFGATLVSILPGLRIDYVLADAKKIEFCSHKVLQTEFSDHNPVVVTAFLK